MPKPKRTKQRQFISALTEGLDRKMRLEPRKISCAQLFDFWSWQRVLNLQCLRIELRESFNAIEKSEEELTLPTSRHSSTISKAARRTMACAVCSIIRRGELSEKSIQWSDGRPLACNSNSAKTRLRLIGSRYASRLEEAGYPTDRDYIWLREGDEDWRPDNDPDRDTDGRPYELRTWHDQLVAMTEPLSRARIQGDVLHSIDQILTKNLEEHVLRPLLQFALAWGQLRISGGSMIWLSMGPLASKRCYRVEKRAQKPGLRNLSWCANTPIAFGENNQLMRGDRINTAESIRPDLK